MKLDFGHTTKVLLLLLMQWMLLCLPAGGLAQEVPSEMMPAAGSSDYTYKLDYGDRITINVFNQADLSGEYTLDGDGRFSMPLIGTVEAAGLTPAELEALLVDRFKPDYLVNPRIFVQVLNYRPYYLIGEVRGTGAFPYRAGMTYMQAIAIAGGFSYRAKQDHVLVIRSDDPEQNEIKLSVDEKVQPGDIIRVAERIF
jgi:polysaccharide export outer membrane protein